MIQALKRRLQTLEQTRSKKGVSIALIILKPDGAWDVKVDLWDGVPGSGTRIESHHLTLEAAQAAVDSLIEKYGGCDGRQPVVIIEDIPMDDD